jgi:hypothetical protein
VQGTGDDFESLDVADTVPSLVGGER